MAEHSAVRAIRDAPDDEVQIDLGGYTEHSVAEFIKLAFMEPIPRKTHMKVTFVVGGGKSVRQKYDDKLTLYVCNALRDCNFDEDRTADKSSVRAYKAQHDTSKNLKFVHVFPEITAPVVEEDEDEEEVVAAPLPPEQRVLVAPIDDFKRTVEFKVTTYSQMKKLLAHLKEAEELVKQAEDQLAQMKQLNAQEETAINDYDFLAEKHAHINAELQKLVDAGELEKYEQDDFLRGLDEKIAGVDKSLAEPGISEKKRTALEAGKQKLQEARAACASKDPIPARPLYREDDLRKLYAKIAPLKELEKQSVKSIEQSKKVGEIPELEDRVAVLVLQSRGWFEDPAKFEERRKRCQDAAVRAAAAKKKAASGQSSSRGNENAWSTARRR